ncbi:MAG: hypothetical protein JXA06_13445 [Bacteroidetes bacterium]|nr:hypothetical protein [Bacteroidota bacterium]
MPPKVYRSFQNKKMKIENNRNKNPDSERKTGLSQNIYFPAKPNIKTAVNLPGSGSDY